MWKYLKERNHMEVKHIWEDSIKTDLKETALEGLDWIDLAQDGDKWWAVVNTVMNFGIH